jgi:hypothetical protein
MLAIFASVPRLCSGPINCSAGQAAAGGASLLRGHAHRGHPHAFGTEEARKRAWLMRRDRFLNYRDGRRPAGWWDYESTVARPADTNYDEAALFDAGLLEPREAGVCWSNWRARFDQSFEPHFAVCLGRGEWLEGDAASQHHWKTLGIPQS